MHQRIFLVSFKNIRVFIAFLDFNVDQKICVYLAIVQGVKNIKGIHVSPLTNTYLKRSTEHKNLENKLILGEEEVSMYSKEISSCFTRNPGRVRQKQPMHIHNGNLLFKKMSQRHTKQNYTRINSKSRRLYCSKISSQL